MLKMGDVNISITVKVSEEMDCFRRVYKKKDIKL